MMNNSQINYSKKIINNKSEMLSLSIKSQDNLSSVSSINNFFSINNISNFGGSK